MGGRHLMRKINWLIDDIIKDQLRYLLGEGGSVPFVISRPPFNGEFRSACSFDLILQMQINNYLFPIALLPLSVFHLHYSTFSVPMQMLPGMHHSWWLSCCVESICQRANTNLHTHRLSNRVGRISFESVIISTNFSDECLVIDLPARSARITIAMLRISI